MKIHSVIKSLKKEIQFKCWVNNWEWKNNSSHQSDSEKWAVIQVREFKKNKVIKNSWNLEVAETHINNQIITYLVVNKMTKIQKIQINKNSRVVFLIKHPRRWIPLDYQTNISTTFSQANQNKIWTHVHYKVLFPWVKNKKIKKLKKWKSRNKTSWKVTSTIFFPCKTLKYEIKRRIKKWR